MREAVAAVEPPLYYYNSGLQYTAGFFIYNLAFFDTKVREIS